MLLSEVIFLFPAVSIGIELWFSLRMFVELIINRIANPDTDRSYLTPENYESVEVTGFTDRASRV